MTIITQSKTLLNYDNVVKIYENKEFINNEPCFYLLAKTIDSINPIVIGEFKTNEQLQSAKIKILSKIEDKIYI